MTKPPFSIDPELVADSLAALARASQGLPPGADQQSANLAAFTEATAATAETYLALARTQIDQALQATRAAADPATDPAITEAWLTQLTQASEQAGAALQARLLADISQARKDP